MIKNPFPIKWTQNEWRITGWQNKLHQIFCPYVKRYNLICYTNRMRRSETCYRCYFYQANIKSRDVIHVCDRCGYQTTGDDPRLFYLTLTNREGGLVSQAELCEGCAKQIGTWLKDEDFFENFWDDEAPDQ